MAIHPLTKPPAAICDNIGYDNIGCDNIRYDNIFPSPGLCGVEPKSSQPTHSAFQDKCMRRLEGTSLVLYNGRDRSDLSR
jgi:hypothetical protein